MKPGESMKEIYDYPTTGSSLVDSVLKYVAENFTADVKLSSVASMKSVSPEHLSRTFKSFVGVGFNEYVNLCRLRLAKEMIVTERSKTVSEIAFECGFNDGNYFSYKFKKLYGISPTKARKEAVSN